MDGPETKYSVAVEPYGRRRRRTTDDDIWRQLKTYQLTNMHLTHECLLTTLVRLTDLRFWLL